MSEWTVPIEHYEPCLFRESRDEDGRVIRQAIDATPGEIAAFLATGEAP